jgi:hypothetical protein
MQLLSVFHMNGVTKRPEDMFEPRTVRYYGNFGFWSGCQPFHHINPALNGVDFDNTNRFLRSLLYVEYAQ